MDIWLPLLLAVPLAAIPLLPAADGLPSALLIAVVNVIPVSLAAIAVGVALWRFSAPQSGSIIEAPHLLAALLLGVILLFSAFTGRLSDWSGHLLLTAAVLWLWTVSGDPGQSKSTADRDDPVFLVDWAEPLRHPIGALTQTILLGAFPLLAAGLLIPILRPEDVALAPVHVSRWPWLGVVVLTYALHAVTLGALAWRVSPVAAIRCAVSTVILSTLLGVGVLCVRLIPWFMLIAGVRAGVAVSYMITDLTGLSVLLPPALLVLALAALALVRSPGGRVGRIAGAALTAVALAALAIGGVVAASHWPAPPASEEDVPATASTPDAPPESNSGTFLQDGSI